MFNGEPTNFHNEELLEWLLIVTNKLKSWLGKIRRKMFHDRWIMFVLPWEFYIPSFTGIISGDLVYNNICARWVPWILIKKHKQNWMELHWLFSISRTKIVMNFWTTLILRAWPGFFISLQKQNGMSSFSLSNKIEESKSNFEQQKMYDYSVLGSKRYPTHWLHANKGVHKSNGLL